MSINLRNIQKAIGKLCSQNPNVELNPLEITIVGVTKHQPLEKIKQAVDAGLTVLGVNHAQQGDELIEALKDEPVRFHFIGHIQSRKTKYFPRYDCIQSLDRLSVAQKLNEQLILADVKLPVLIELNIGNESSKSGIPPKELKQFLKEVDALSNLRPAGLMCMPPPLNDLEKRRPFFTQTKSLYDQFKDDYPFRFLSMGTSEDYLLAIEEGSNMVRLGSCLFGPRTKSNR